jgi:hypothetical protein
MKRIIYILLGTMIISSSCQNSSKPAMVDLAAAKNDVNALLDKYNADMKSKNVDSILSLIADDGLYCGTDATELMNKSQLSDLVKQTIADTSFVMDYSVDKREILVSPDGNSAVAIEQMIIKPFSEKMPVRMVYHLIRTGEGWHFNFLSWNFIPNNDDLPKINKALE